MVHGVTKSWTRLSDFTFIFHFSHVFKVLLGGSDSKNLPAMWETQIQSLGQEDPLEEGMAILSSILAWRIP